MILIRHGILPRARTALAAATLLLAGSWTLQAVAQPSPPMARPAPAVPMAGCVMAFGLASVDYGSFTAGQLTLDASRRYQLERRSVPLTINCPSARPIVLRLNAPARHDGAAKFAGAGAVQVELGHVTVDGVATRVFNPNLPHGPQTQIAMQPGDTIALEQGRAARSVTAQIVLQPQVADADVRVTDQTQWSATLQFELLDP